MISFICPPHLCFLAPISSLLGKTSNLGEKQRKWSELPFGSATVSGSSENSAVGSEELNSDAQDRWKNRLSGHAALQWLSVTFGVNLRNCYPKHRNVTRNKSGWNNERARKEREGGKDFYFHLLLFIAITPNHSLLVAIATHTSSHSNPGLKSSSARVESRFTRMPLCVSDETSRQDWNYSLTGLSV